jgi:hypothetical protein
MKSRSSTGVGQKIDLEYNIDTMRITDAGGEDGENSFRKPSLMDSIKARASVSATESAEGAVKWDRPQPAEGHDPLDPTPRTPTPRVSADVQSAKLKQLLGKIKTA